MLSTSCSLQGRGCPREEDCSCWNMPRIVGKGGEARNEVSELATFAPTLPQTSPLVFCFHHDAMTSTTTKKAVHAPRTATHPPSSTQPSSTKTKRSPWDPYASLPPSVKRKVRQLCIVKPSGREHIARHGGRSSFQDERIAEPLSTPCLSLSSTRAMLSSPSPTSTPCGSRRKSLKSDCRASSSNLIRPKAKFRTNARQNSPSKRRKKRRNATSDCVKEIAA